MKTINRLRLWILKMVVHALLPKEIFVGKYDIFGKMRVTFGELDDRGVMRGISEDSVFEKH